MKTKTQKKMEKKLKKSKHKNRERVRKAVESVRANYWGHSRTYCILIVYNNFTYLYQI